MGPPKLEYPTHSPSLKLEQFLLQANTETFMTFSIEKETFQKKRGLFQSKIYCEDNIQNYEAVNCYKKCFIRSLQVSVLNIIMIITDFIYIYDRYHVFLRQLILLMGLICLFVMKMRNSLTWKSCLVKNHSSHNSDVTA